MTSKTVVVAVVGEAVVCIQLSMMMGLGKVREMRAWKRELKFLRK